MGLEGHGGLSAESTATSTDAGSMKSGAAAKTPQKTSHGVRTFSRMAT